MGFCFVVVARLVGKDLVVTVLLTVVAAVEETAERKADNMKRETSAFLPRCCAGELMNSSSRALVTATYASLRSSSSAAKLEAPLLPAASLRSFNRSPSSAELCGRIPQTLQLKRLQETLAPLIYEWSLMQSDCLAL